MAINMQVLKKMVNYMSGANKETQFPKLLPINPISNILAILHLNTSSHGQIL
jgi:hypothetical protein